MDVFCDRLKLGPTAALDCQTSQNKGRYRKRTALISTHLVAYDLCISYLTTFICLIIVQFWIDPANDKVYKELVRRMTKSLSSPSFTSQVCLIL